MSESYNGWPNKATFDIAYAMDTDPLLCRRTLDLASRSTSVEDLAKLLEQLCEELVFKQCPFDGTALAILRRNLIGDALDVVDWSELAKQRISLMDGLKPD